MSQGVGVRDGNRLPWLEPYRAPAKAKGMPKAPIAAAGAIALAVIASLSFFRSPAPVQPAPEVRTELPAASAAIEEPQVPPAVVAPAPAMEPVRAARPASPRPSRRIVTAVPEREAYDQVMSQQVADALLAASAPTTEPAPPPVIAQPARPVVNPAAKVVRGQTVQLGIYLTQREAEIAWASAIRDYTYLVTMPKNIAPVRLRPRGKLYYRLQLGTPSKKHAKQLCGNLKSTGRACTVA